MAKSEIVKSVQGTTTSYLSLVGIETSENNERSYKYGHIQRTIEISKEDISDDSITFDLSITIPRKASDREACGGSYTKLFPVVGTTCKLLQNPVQNNLSSLNSSTILSVFNTFIQDSINIFKGESANPEGKSSIELKTLQDSEALPLRDPNKQPEYEYEKESTGYTASLGKTYIDQNSQKTTKSTLITLSSNMNKGTEDYRDKQNLDININIPIHSEDIEFTETTSNGKPSDRVMNNVKLNDHKINGKIEEIGAAIKDFVEKRFVDYVGERTK